MQRKGVERCSASPPRLKIKIHTTPWVIEYLTRNFLVLAGEEA